MLGSTTMSRSTQDSWARTRETSTANLSWEVSEQKQWPQVFVLLLNLERTCRGILSANVQSNAEASLDPTSEVTAPLQVDSNSIVSCKDADECKWAGMRMAA